MKVKELIKKLKQMNPNAQVFIIPALDDGNGYQKAVDCEEEFSDLVTIGCELDK